VCSSPEEGSPVQNCDINAFCDSDFLCQCKAGFLGSGQVGECFAPGPRCKSPFLEEPCGPHSVCTPLTEETYYCSCVQGFAGSIDDSAESRWSCHASSCSPSCHPNALCIAPVCKCNDGYYGDGLECALYGSDEPRFAGELIFSCADRMIDHLDDLFQNPPVLRDKYIINCLACNEYYTRVYADRRLPIWGAQPFTFDSIFCAAAQSIADTPDGTGKFVVDVNFNVPGLTPSEQLINSFAARDENGIHGRSWSGSYPVVMLIQEIDMHAPMAVLTLLMQQTQQIKQTIPASLVESLRSMAKHRHN